MLLTIHLFAACCVQLAGYLFKHLDHQTSSFCMDADLLPLFKVCVYVRGSCRCLEVNYPCLCADGTGVSWQCMQAGLMSWLNGQFVSPAVPTERLNLHRTGTSCKFDGKLGVDLCASHTAPLTPA
jgi:hypothetical protein